MDQYPKELVRRLCRVIYKESALVTKILSFVKISIEFTSKQGKIVTKYKMAFIHLNIKMLNQTGNIWKKYLI
jgi:hypothetical protein